MSFLPSEVIKNGIDAYIDKHPTNSQKIYWVVLLAIMVVLISLPYIYVDVSVQESGIIRPVAEKADIKSSVSEFVDSVFVKEGNKVKEGDTIITLRSNSSNYKINYQESRIKDLQDHLHDLKYLGNGERPDVFNSDTRRQEYLYFQKQISEYKTNLEKARIDYERHTSLFEKKVISEEEYQKYHFDYEKTKNQLASLLDNQISKWQTDLNANKNSYYEMLSYLKMEIKDKDMYVITSPISGTVEQFRGIYKGSNIQSGTTVAIVSPDYTLFLEVYVSPRNIGYIQIGMPVNIQIESFNYNEWGTISGKVIDISSDFFTDNSTAQSYYMVKCSLDNEYLTHRNQVKGYLKKGMTVSTHFMITRRSLFDLLYQRMDNWINPTQHIVDAK